MEQSYCFFLEFISLEKVEDLACRVAEDIYILSIGIIRDMQDVLRDRAYREVLLADDDVWMSLRVKETWITRRGVLSTEDIRTARSILLLV